MLIDFMQKTAVVTGGAGGIGRAVVKSLLDSNAKVAMIDVSQNAIESAMNEFGSNPNLRPFVLDITNTSAIASSIASIILSMGDISILVQTAGLLKGKPALELTQTDWDIMLNINARGTFFVMQQVVAQSMKHTGGCIVNFASMAGIRGMNAKMASMHYSASKGAVVAMSMQAATEWAEYGIRCNAVAPGGVRTKAMENLDFSADLLSPVPLKQLSNPQDIANTVLFLCSDQARMITGQTIVIDGGSSIVGY
jgi:NAD(P)-dependent dehydrogenase (short-subunit alcohol dehydrogenase family)